ncbi:hypothetical protein CFBP2118_03297 [Pseudomonas syringae pv. syringae]|nr:hypothetical protein CFBP2118_03297 [Pseudomonas syringae pv. syringae]
MSHNKIFIPTVFLYFLQSQTRAAIIASTDDSNLVHTNGCKMIMISKHTQMFSCDIDIINIILNTVCQTPQLTDIHFFSIEPQRERRGA